MNNLNRLLSIDNISAMEKDVVKFSSSAFGILTSSEENLRKLNIWSPLLLGLVFLVSGLYGVLEVIPVLYSDNYYWMVAMQVVLLFTFVQLVSHWYLTRNTHSFYNGNVESADQRKLCKSDVQSNHYSCVTPGGHSRKMNSRAGSSDGINTRTRKNRGVAQRPSNTVAGYAHTSTLSWSVCGRCDRERPPRCHHCPVCGKCILKRHHHCFFTGQCIGVNNERHFIVFMFWGAVVTLIGTAHMLPYAFIHLLRTGQISYSDFLPAVALCHVILGQADAVVILLSLIFWTVLAFTAIAVVFLYRILLFTYFGFTDVEYQRNIRVDDRRGFWERLRYIFGENWFFTFVFPFKRKTHFKEDAINWPFLDLSVSGEDRSKLRN